VDEVADIASFCGSLVLNPGTLSAPWIEGMHIAGRKACEIGIPTILDPVGVGATPLRQKTCTQLSTYADIIKGNAGEISFLAGALANVEAGAQSRGVDSAGTLHDPASVVRTLSVTISAAIAMSGATDYVSDRAGRDVVAIQNGNEWLGRLTGTGCTTTTLVGAFAAAIASELKGKGVDANNWTPSDPDFDPYLVASVGGLLTMCIAAELAVSDPSVKGTMSFKTALFDAISNLTPEIIQRYARIEFA
ncbi:Hydroxyethylthiazole kinase family-domain-containing protein, partial [Chytriomyces sp. MP71]